MDIKYINHGAFFTEYLEGKNSIILRFYGYYHNTKIINFYFYFDKKDPTRNYTSIDIKDGGYHSSPCTSKAINRFVNYATEWLYNDFGDKETNNCMNYAYHCITDMHDLYFEKYRKCNGKVLSGVTYRDRYYLGYFGFNY